MVRASLFASILCATAIAAWACGADPAPAQGAPPDSASPPPTPPDDAGGELDANADDTLVTPPAGAGKAYCDAVFGSVVKALDTCCTAEDKTTDLYELSSNLGGFIAMRCESKLDASIAKGRLLYRPGKAATCASASAARYASDKCTNLTEPADDPAFAACTAVFAGTVKSGGACAEDFECEEGLTCFGYTPTSEGTCSAPSAIDAPCGRGASDASVFDRLVFMRFGSHPACVAGARCDDDDRKCHPLVPAGGDCTSDDSCEDNHVCSVGKCVARADVGAPCTTARSCKSGAYCNQRVQPSVCAAKKIAGSECFDPNLNTECIGRCVADGGALPGNCVSHCGSR